jgi:hypothetical protein
MKMEYWSKNLNLNSMDHSERLKENGEKSIFIFEIWSYT